MDLNHPLFESIVLPLTMTLVLSGALRGMLGERWGKNLAAAAIGLSVLFAYTLILGAPAWSPRTGLQKLPLIMALLMVGGVLLDVLKPDRATTAWAALAATGATALWLGEPQLAGNGGDVARLLVLTSLIALLSLAGLVAAPADGAYRCSLILPVALGLAGASFNAGSMALMQTSLTLAAAVGGFALWNWPTPRMPFGATGIAVSGMGCFALALLLVLLTEIRPWALLPLALIFAMVPVAHRLPRPARFARAAVDPLYITAMALIPMILTIILAQNPAPVDGLYYR